MPYTLWELVGPMLAFVGLIALLMFVVAGSARVVYHANHPTPEMRAQYELARAINARILQEQEEMVRARDEHFAGCSVCLQMQGPCTVGQALQDRIEGPDSQRCGNGNCLRPVRPFAAALDANGLAPRPGYERRCVYCGFDQPWKPSIPIPPKRPPKSHVGAIILTPIFVLLVLAVAAVLIGQWALNMSP